MLRRYSSFDYKIKAEMGGGSGGRFQTPELFEVKIFISMDFHRQKVPFLNIGEK